jgi:hypothetical protein
MLDVMLAAGPAGVAAYGEAWASASGTAMDAWELATGQAWATAVSNAMFVGAVAERSAETADLMLDEAEVAVDRLGKQLSRRT